ncbi:MAG TPA: phosphoribosyltransferase [Gemmatimonadales bacterium]|nr:phosphoribosyltransferase [Gemmatimonadales bacterium]
MSRFQDRADGGRQLARALAAYAGRPDLIVLGLPRGGVPVAAEVARALGAPLEVFVVRKLGVPGHAEYAMGAIASGGIRLLDDRVIRDLGVTEGDIDRTTAVERLELERREHAYRGSRPFPDLTGLTAILVDDGLATGSTMRAAVTALREEGPERIVVAVPVGAPGPCEMLRDLVDEVLCLATPASFIAVSQWYEDFTETTDEAIHDLLAVAGRSPPAGGSDNRKGAGR